MKKMSRLTKKSARHVYTVDFLAPERHAEPRLSMNTTMSSDDDGREREDSCRRSPLNTQRLGLGLQHCDLIERERCARVMRYFSPQYASGQRRGLVSIFCTMN